MARVINALRAGGLLTTYRTVNDESVGAEGWCGESVKNGQGRLLSIGVSTAVECLAFYTESVPGRVARAPWRVVWRGVCVSVERGLDFRNQQHNTHDVHNT